jgi:[protein-PII] uridylyltransferase
MSTISQREDTSDPDVIYKFAKHVGDQRHLDHLWVLTVADINATNPRLWTEWKGALMSNLYFETKQVLQSGLDQPTNRDAWVNDAKNSVLKILDLQSVSESEANQVWGDVDDQFFLRERAADIAYFTKGILDGDDNQPVIQIRDVGVEIPVATQIFLHTKSTKNLFAVVAATMDKMGLTIQDARLQTTKDNRTFDVFYVLNDKDLPVGSNNKLCKSISDNLKAAIQSPEKINLNVSRRTSRQLKNFTMKTKVSLRNDNETETSILQVITPDRPGLLAKIANIFSRFDLVLYNAKISTLGERVEDTFYLRTADNYPINNQELGENLKQTIRNELDSRIKESQQESNFQSINIGQ